MDELDEADEKDSDATEAAVAAAVAAIILAHDPASDAPRPPTGWLGALDAAIGAVLQSFLVRVAVAFLTGSGRPDPVLAQQAATDIRTRTIERGAREIGMLYDNVRSAFVAIDSGPDTVTAERVGVGSELLSTRLVIEAREQLRLLLARRIGATDKTWRTRRDSRVRTNHVALEGETIPIDDVFVQPDGAMLEYPQDPLAPLSATARCRCRLSFRVRLV